MSLNLIHIQLQLVKCISQLQPLVVLFCYNIAYTWITLISVGFKLQVYDDLNWKVLLRINLINYL